MADTPVMERAAHDLDHTASTFRRPQAEAALRDDPVVWLSSVQSDGRPHLVPVWFHWDGEQIVAFSKPRARKVDNLRDEPRVMLAVGMPGPDFEVELIEATAELPDTPAADVMPAGFGAKYRELLRRANLTVQRFAEVYSQPIVLRPTRFLGYGGRGWSEGAAVT
ncbi:MAG TPA: pyridoxamine 5'-phosphate oxidase family protein [Candidatus Limnocylindrales bacterium]|nr:pyridoxamine 5'-phosphate oxidase family protein [Candidatus Limnocylindrales bacterium]